MKDEFVQTVPKKVLRTAAAKGMHGDCVAAGPNSMCPDCYCIVVHSMDEHYAHIGTPDQIIDAYMHDLVNGQ